jgi:hypothetical protein
MNTISKNLGISVYINSCSFYNKIISKVITQSSSHNTSINPELSINPIIGVSFQNANIIHLPQELVKNDTVLVR